MVEVVGLDEYAWRGMTFSNGVGAPAGACFFNLILYK